MLPTILQEGPISLNKAAAQIPGRNGRPQLNPATVWRWCVKGNRYGIRLESMVIGGNRYTSLAALERFIMATAQAGDGILSPLKIRTPGAKTKAVAHAERKLREAGV